MEYFESRQKAVSSGEAVGDDSTKKKPKPKPKAKSKE